jgi:hypothetical protein
MLMTSNDSFPIRAIARDARGVPIADATVNVTPLNIALNGIWAGPTIVNIQTFGTLTPDLTGVALPANNPGAPQIPPAIDASSITMLPPDTATASATAVRNITAVVLDSNAVPAVNSIVYVFANAGTFPNAVQADNLGQVSFPWTLPDTTGFYTLTAVRSTTNPLNSLADSAGKFVVRQSVVVKPDVASPLMSKLATSATTVVNTTGSATITVTVKDQFGNLIKNATGAEFALTVTSAGTAGTIGAVTCAQGVCTATYTAPNAAGTDQIHAKIGGVEILFSPITITIN